MSVSPVSHDLIDVIVTAVQHLAWRANADGTIHLTYWHFPPGAEEGEWVDSDINAYDDEALTTEGANLLRAIYNALRERYEDCEGLTDTELAEQWGYDAGPYAYWLGKVPGTAMNLHPRALGVARRALSWYEYNACSSRGYVRSRAHALCYWLKEQMLDHLVHPLDKAADSDYAWHAAMSGELGEGEEVAFLNDLSELSRKVRMIAQPIVTSAE